jgi:hypothetical protein
VLVKSGSFAFIEGSALIVVAKANVPLVRLAKIELKKMCVGKYEKYRRVGKECRLSCCPVEIWTLCWSPVKISVLVYVYSRLLFGCCVVL